MCNFWKDSAELISMKNYVQILPTHFAPQITLISTEQLLKQYIFFKSYRTLSWEHHTVIC